MQVLVRRWLDEAGITDPVLRQCYTECLRRVARSGHRRLFLQAIPTAARPFVGSVIAYGLVADECADTGPLQTRPRRLDAFARTTLEACASGRSHDPVIHAMAHTFKTFTLPVSLVEGMFDAMRRDLDFRDFATYEELRQWSATMTGGLFAACAHAMGCVGSVAEMESAGSELCALAQLADSLMDLAEDLDNGRLYLPLEDLDRFGVRPEDIRAKRWAPAVADLIAFEAERFTGQAPAVVAALEDSVMGPVVRVLMEHWALCVAEVVAAGPQVLHRPVKPPVAHLLDVWRPVRRSVIPC